MLPRLLDRHLVFFGPLAAAVHLAVRQRIRPQVVRRKGNRQRGDAA